MALSQPPGSAPNHKIEQNLLAVFAIAFLARLMDRIGYWATLAGWPMTFDNYPITEWLINYEAGFFRRGLIGSLLLWLWRTFQVPPNLIIVGFSLAVFFVLSLFVWVKAKGKVPRWILFTTPILGYPVFVNGIMLRKDIFTLLIIALAFEMMFARRFRGADLIACLLLCLATLSHEMTFFLAFLIFAVVAGVREYVHLHAGQSSLSPGKLPSLLATLPIIGPRLVWLLIPLATFVAIFLRSEASPSATSAIAASWQSAYDPMLPFPGSTGAIDWLSKSPEELLALSKSTFAMSIYGVPYWVIVLLSIISGIIFLAAAISSYSPIRAWFFVLCALLEFVFMLPLFYFACDHGRWIIMSLMVAFLLSIQVPSTWQEQVAEWTQFPDQLRNFAVPTWFAPLGLAFWGLSVVIWAPHGAPIVFLLQVYFYLRWGGIIPRLSL